MTEPAPPIPTKAMPPAELGELMDIDTSAIADPGDRLRVILAQWHMDEYRDESVCFGYADRFMARLEEEGLCVIKL